MNAFIILVHVLVIGTPEVHDFTMYQSGYMDNDACTRAATKRAQFIAGMINASSQLNGRVQWSCERLPTRPA